MESYNVLINLKNEDIEWFRPSRIPTQVEGEPEGQREAKHTLISLFPGRQKPDNKVPVQLRRVEEEAPVKREHAPEEEEGGYLVKNEKVAVDNAVSSCTKQEEKAQDQK